MAGTNDRIIPAENGERLAKEIIKEFVPSGKDPERIIKEKKLMLASEAEVRKKVEKVLKENEKAVEDYKKGIEKALNFLIGMVLKELRARADPNLVKKIILEQI